MQHQGFPTKLSLLCLSPVLLMVLRLIWLCGGFVGALCPIWHIRLDNSTTLLCRDAPTTNPAKEVWGTGKKTQAAWRNRGDGGRTAGNEFQSRGRQALMPPPRGGVFGRQLAKSAGSHGDGRRRGMLGCRWESGKKGQALINLAAAGSTGGELLLLFSVFLMSAARLGGASG